MDQMLPIIDQNGRLLVAVNNELMYTDGFLSPVTTDLGEVRIDPTQCDWYIWIKPDPKPVRDFDSMEAVETQFAIGKDPKIKEDIVEFAPGIPLTASDGSIVTEHRAYLLSSSQAKEYIATKYGQRGIDALAQVLKNGRPFYLP